MVKTRISQRKPGMSKLAFKKLLRPKHNAAKQTLVPVGKYNIKVGTSKAEKVWLDKMERVFNTKIIREQLIYGPIINGNKRQIYVCDGYIPQQQICLEYNGNRAHGGVGYPHHKFDKQYGCTYGELYQKTYFRYNWLLQHGYKVFYVWESDDKKGIIGRFYRAGDPL